MNVGPYLARWSLTQDGAPIGTRSSWLLPVLRGDQPAMLKIALHAEEQRGAALVHWWQGKGAARVLAHEGDALLLERATGTRSLSHMARTGQDDEASRILCAVAANLHAPRGNSPPALVPLAEWFQELWHVADQHGGILRRAAIVARELLDDPRDVTVLHGDIHHGNILDFGRGGWLAIDPKGLVGERGFDFANIFTNPDSQVAVRPGRLARQATVVADAANLDRTRLLCWVLAYSGLSSAWLLSEADADRAALPLAVAALAAAEIGQE